MMKFIYQSLLEKTLTEKHNVDLDDPNIRVTFSITRRTETKNPKEYTVEYIGTIYTTKFDDGLPIDGNEYTFVIKANCDIPSEATCEMREITDSDQY